MAPLGKHDVAKLPDSAVRNDNVLQRSFVTYTYRMIGRGRSGVLKQDELKMPADQATEVTFMRFQMAWAAEIERAAFIDQRLTPWMAGRDAIMDVGFATGVVAQPDRETPAELVVLSEADKADRRSTIAEPLAALSLALTEAALGAESLVGGADQRYLREVIDGLWVTALRAEFANAVVSAALSEAPTDDLSRAEAALSAAAEVVARRHADLHDPHGERLVSASWENPTLYDFGYLLRAEELCFWKKELAEVREAHGLSTDPSPLCAL
jgi:hypothetical protein